jgi:hypothetical protein
MTKTWEYPTIEVAVLSAQRKGLHLVVPQDLAHLRQRDEKTYNLLWPIVVRRIVQSKAAAQQTALEILCQPNALKSEHIKDLLEAGGFCLTAKRKEFKAYLKRLVLTSVLAESEEDRDQAHTELVKSEQNASIQPAFAEAFGLSKRELLKLSLTEIEAMISASDDRKQRAALWYELATNHPDMASKRSLITILWKSCSDTPFETVDDFLASRKTIASPGTTKKRKFQDLIPADNDDDIDMVAFGDSEDHLVAFVDSLRDRIERITNKQIMYFVDRIRQILRKNGVQTVVGAMKHLLNDELLWLAKRDKHWKFFYDDDASTQKRTRISKSDIPIFISAFGNAEQDTPATEERQSPVTLSGGDRSEGSSDSESGGQSDSSESEEAVEEEHTEEAVEEEQAPPPKRTRRSSRLN